MAYPQTAGGQDLGEGRGGERRGGEGRGGEDPGSDGSQVHPPPGSPRAGGLGPNGTSTLQAPSAAWWLLTPAGSCAVAFAVPTGLHGLGTANSE